MNTEFQGFTEEFRNYMNDQNAWPPEKPMEDWIRQNHVGRIKTHYFARLKRGDTIAAHSVKSVVKVLLIGSDGLRLKEKSKHLDRAREIVFRFLKHKGVVKPESLRSDEALQFLCGPVEAHSKSIHLRDRFLDGLDAFFDILGTKRLAKYLAQECPKEGGADSAVLWGMVTVGRMLAPQDPPLPQQEAIALLERHFGNGFTRSGSEATIRKMQTIDPWVVAFARGEYEPTGASIILPLTKNAYERAYRGEFSCFEFRREDYTVPSKYLFVKMVAERPEDLGGQSLEDATAALVRCTLAQTSVLSRLWHPPFDEPLRLLTFDAAPVSRQRAEVQGYKPIGATMKGTNLELLGRTLKFPGTTRKDIAAGAALVLLGVLLGRNVPEP